MLTEWYLPNSTHWIALRRFNSYKTRPFTDFQMTEKLFLNSKNQYSRVNNFDRMPARKVSTHRVVPTYKSSSMQNAFPKNLDSRSTVCITRSNSYSLMLRKWCFGTRKSIRISCYWESQFEIEGHPSADDCAMEQLVLENLWYQTETTSYKVGMARWLARWDLPMYLKVNYSGNLIDKATHFFDVHIRRFPENG